MAPLTYGSVCSGIEAASVAWAPLGWEAAFVSEIDAAPRAVLQHRFPEVPLHGDFTTIQAGDYRPIQLLVGGTPCQSFSVAGLRGGLADDRGNLALQFLRLADRLRPRWLVWENVPGVLSSNGGRDFGAILGGLVELGYGFAYRVLDAQYIRVDGYGRAVPQRRRRVFVVGYLGDWRRAAAVLFERASLRGDPAPRREAGAGVASTLKASSARCSGTLGGTEAGGGWRIGPDEAAGGQLIAAPLAPAISASNPYGDHESREGLLVAALTAGDRGISPDQACGNMIVPVAADMRNGALDDVAMSLQAGGMGGDRGLCPNAVPHVLAYGGNDTRGPIQVATAVNAHGGPHGRLDFESETFIAFDTTQITSAQNRNNPQPGDPCHPLAAGAHAPAVAFTVAQNSNGLAWESDISPTLQARTESPESNQFSGIRQGWSVRRLTPTECERLQGFPDGWTAVPWRGGLMPDGPRYKMLGNSMACNAMRWIGRRIEAVEADLSEAA